MSAPYQFNSGIADAIVQWQQVTFQVIINGNTNDTLIKPQTDAPGIYAYCEIGGVQPSSAGTGLLFIQDTGTNYPAFDSNANPSSFGLLLLTGDAFDPSSTTVAPSPSFELLRSPAGAVVTLSPNGDSTTGVTASNNLAFSCVCAGLDFDSAITSYEFLFRVNYKRAINQPGS